VYVTRVQVTASTRTAGNKVNRYVKQSEIKQMRLLTLTTNIGADSGEAARHAPPNN